MSTALIVTGVVIALAGAGLILYSKRFEKSTDNQEFEFIAGSVTAIACVLIGLIGIFANSYSIPSLALYIISVIGASVGAAFAWVANERMKSLPKESDDYKNYKQKWLIGGSVGVGVGILVMILVLYFGKKSTQQLYGPNEGYAYGTY
jgi:hypothetical protein